GSAIEQATVSVTGAGGLSLTPAPVYANNINVGTANASYSYAGDANHEGSTDSKGFAIGKAATVTTVTVAPGAPFTYTGSAIEQASVSVTGAGGLSLTPAPVYANNINVGTANASYSYAGDANHEGSTDSKDFAIGKANAVITVTPYSVTYDGVAHTSTFTAVGVESPSPVDLTGLMTVNETTHINAGTYNADAWSFAGNGNYLASSGTVNNSIGKSVSITTVTIPVGPFAYTGLAITPATVTVTRAGGLSLSPAVVYANNVNAGNATASYSYVGDANHLASSDSKNFSIALASLTVKADDKSKYCGMVDPLLTGTLTGVLGSDGITASYSISGTSIIPALNDPNGKLGNYSVLKTNGLLTINAITKVDLPNILPTPIGLPITLSATVYPNVSGVSIAFLIDGVQQGSAVTTNASGVASITLPAMLEEVYGVTAVAGNACATSNTGYLPVYDPSRGYAAGNGSFISPANAYPANQVIGKGRFGFSVKYKKGTNVPQGELDFQLKKNNLRFESNSFQWLVIVGNKSQFKGTGTINGSGTYNFIVTAIDNGNCDMQDEHDGDIDDGMEHRNVYDLDPNHFGYHRDGKKCNDAKCTIPDQFRIKITRTDGAVVYDNQMGVLVSDYTATNITRGNIEVNDTKITKKVVAVAPETTITSTLFVYPNPTSYKYTLFLEGGSKEKVQVEVFDMVGRLVKHIESNDGQAIEFGEDLPTGAYFTTVTQGTYQKTVRLIKQ
ncbi:T9SS type A sorting domain-containing protein, partial [Flavobacterium soyangense]